MKCEGEPKMARSFSILVTIRAKAQINIYVRTTALRPWLKNALHLWTLVLRFS